MATAAEIGEWLMSKVREAAPDRAYQRYLVTEMIEQFGEEWSYTNRNGNPAIDKKVLAEFNTLKDELVIWESSEQAWRVVDAETLAELQERQKQRAEYRAESKARQAEWDAAHPR